jgi:hypothetical protein
MLHDKVEKWVRKGVTKERGKKQGRQGLQKTELDGGCVARQSVQKWKRWRKDCSSQSSVPGSFPFAYCSSSVAPSFPIHIHHLQGGELFSGMLWAYLADTHKTDADCSIQERFCIHARGPKSQDPRNQATSLLQRSFWVHGPLDSGAIQRHCTILPDFPVAEASSPATWNIPLFWTSPYAYGSFHKLHTNQHTFK